MNLANLPTELTQFESPHFLDIRRDKQRTTLLCGGLPYHRRFGLRKLDTLLVVQGETARSFRLGIGIDVPHPMAAALGFLAPPLVLARSTAAADAHRLAVSSRLPQRAGHALGAVVGTRRVGSVSRALRQHRRTEPTDPPQSAAFASACWKPTAAACDCGLRCFRARGLGAKDQSRRRAAGGT